MRITKLHVKGLLGLTDVTIDCGRITEIQGANGSGKSSLLEALKASIGGGNLASLKRVGEKGDPSTVLVIDDGAMKVERSGKDTVVNVRVGESEAYEPKRKPQTFLESLFDTQLSNPLNFLSAPANKQADLLLEVLAPELDAKALEAAVGASAWPGVVAIVSAGGHPLSVLKAVRESLYAARTGVNGAKEDKARTVHELRPKIPAHLAAETESALPALEQERDFLNDQITKGRANAESEARRIVSEAEATFETADGAIVSGFKAGAGKVRTQGAEDARRYEADTEQKAAALRQQIADLQQALAEAKAGLKAEEDAKVNALRDAADVTRKAAAEALEASRTAADGARAGLLAAVEPIQNRFTEVAAAIATQRAEAERLITVRSQKALADQLEAEAKGLAEKADELTAAIKAVDVFKAEMLNGVPVDGLEVEGKEIRIHGIPFATLNTAKRISIAVQVAALRAKRCALPVLFIDGAEALDKEQYAALLREVEASGCQAFVSRVSEGPLKTVARERMAS